MPFDTGIADRLRGAGLRVVEVDGWKVRGRWEFDPKGSVDHHTAGARLGNAPSLRICTHGRSGLPGPLCHVLVGRDNTCYVVAAGRANHAGAGSWKGLAGNTPVWGVERENVGTSAEPWRPDQTETAGRVHAALISKLAKPDPMLVCLHKEWTSRKIDPHSITGGQLRTLVRKYLAGGSPPGEPEVNRMIFVQKMKKDDPKTPVDGVIYVVDNMLHPLHAWGHFVWLANQVYGPADEWEHYRRRVVKIPETDPLWGLAVEPYGAVA